MVLNVSLPDIANDFNKSPASTSWVNTAFMLLDQRLLPMEVDQSTYLYSNLLLLFSGIIVISWLVTLNVYKHSQRDF